MPVMDPGDQFALSVQALSKLKYTARQTPQRGLDQVAQQFEALFLQNMLEQMRATVPDSGLLESKRTDMYRSMLDRQWAQTLAERGIGLADMLTRQLDRYVPEPDAHARAGRAGPPVDDEAIAGVRVAEPRSLAPSEPLASVGEQSERFKAAGPDRSVPPLLAAGNDAGPLVALTADVQPLVGNANANSVSYARQLDLLPERVSAFLQRMGPAAQATSRETGIPGKLILAQAALETGWGRHEMEGDNGRPSFNVFNIKAVGWNGDRTRVTTTEYVDGRMQKTREDFRVYDSYDAAFADYARLLTESPRYAPVLTAPDAKAAARQLEASGYATDPDYADKLIAIMAMIPDAAQAGPQPLFHASDALFDGMGSQKMDARGNSPEDSDLRRLRLTDAYSRLSRMSDNAPLRIF